MSKKDTRHPTMFRSGTKALAPLVAVMLLLIVATVTGVALQNWYTNFTSKSLAQAESQTSESITLTKIMDNLNGTIYFRNGYNTNLSISDIFIGDKSCGISTTATVGMNEIPLGNCSQNLTSYRQELKIYTDRGVYTKFLYFSEGIPETVVSLGGSEEEEVSSNNDYYLLTNSLRFNDDDSAYLSRTPSIDGNRTTWTWSAWVKRGNLNSAQRIMGVFSGTTDSEWFSLSFYTIPEDSIIITGYSTVWRTTNTLYRDTSSWMNLVVSVDTTLSNGDDRIKLYIDGNQVTNFKTSNNPSQNSELGISRSGYEYNISANYLGLDGYLSEVNFIDGQALDASYFGQNDSYGNWIPKEFNVLNTSKGTYGINGFYLPFNQSTDLGKDYSGNENNFTVNNIDEGEGLLIHSDNSDGSTSFIDSSGRGHSITTSGTVTHSTSTSKFGNSSLNFEDSGYLSVTDSNDFAFGSEDFTIDLWFNVNSSCTGSNNIGLMSMGTSNTNRATFGIGDCDTSLNFYWYEGSMSLSGGSVSKGTWYHTAVVRSGSNFSLYLNGVRKASATSSSSFTDYSTFYVGRSIEDANPTPYMYGHIDEFRITKGKALWTNEFTPPTSPATYLDSPSEDQVIDTPTNNFATLNPNIYDDTNLVYSDGNLRAAIGAADGTSISTLGVSKGKWVTEFEKTGSNNVGFGIMTQNADFTLSAGGISTPSYTYLDSGSKVISGSTTSYGSSYSQGDIIRIELNLDDYEIEFFKNNVSQGTISISETDETWFFAGGSGSGSENWEVNFGQKKTSSTTYFENATGFFTYEPTNGFKALTVNNIRSNYENIIPRDYFEPLLYTGNGAVRNITGLSFSPDFVWIKDRDATYSSRLYDSLRGVGNVLYSDATNAQDSAQYGISTFLDNGFTLGTEVGSNANSDDFVSWNWKESLVSGFDIITYTGDGTSGTRNIVHELSSTPDLILLKSLDVAASWRVWSPELASGKNLYLDSNLGESTEADRIDTTNSTTFSVYSTNSPYNPTNQMSSDYIAYLFTSVEGYSKFGSYTGNGNTDGPFVYTGFKPAYLMVKRIDSTGNWQIGDNKIDPTNIHSHYLYADSNQAEVANNDVDGHYDLLSNGFKIRNIGGNYNTNGATYIYIAFAEVPMSGIPSPYLNLTSNVSEILAYGSSVNLTWDSRYTSACIASGDWSGTKNTSDSLELSITSTSTYTLNCIGNTKNETQSISFNVCAPTEIVAGEECIQPFSRSLIFNDDDTAYLNKTFTSAGNRTTWTWSGWVKRSLVTGALGGTNYAQMLFTAGYTDSGYTDAIGFGYNGSMRFWLDGAITANLESAVVFKDPSTWYHIVAVADTSQTTSSDRMKIWVDGVQITDWSSSSYPSQYTETGFNNNYPHVFGQLRRGVTDGSYTNQIDPRYALEGYLGEVHFIDGEVLGPEYFGQNDSYGVWQPKVYTGSYGTNGFYLPFNDNTSLGRDYSGNSNEFTANSLASSDVTLDNSNDNYATMNPLDNFGTIVLSNGNLNFDNNNGANWDLIRTTLAIPPTGKWVWEVKIGSDKEIQPGIALGRAPNSGGSSPTYVMTYDNGGNIWNGTNTNAEGAFVSGDIIRIEVNSDNNQIEWFLNNVSQRVDYLFSDLSSGLFPSIRSTTGIGYFNFGQLNNLSGTSTTYYPNSGGSFVNEPTNGFKALSVQNINNITGKINASEFFDTILYTGSGVLRNVTGLSFSPDLVWMKGRDVSTNHNLYDTLRGTSNRLSTDYNGGQDTPGSGGVVTSFLDDGFTLTAASSPGSSNDNTKSYVSWNWKESEESGFDILTFTGDGTTGRAIEHNLTSAPDLMIVKRTSSAGSWTTWHRSFVTADDTDYILLEGSGAKNSAGSTDNWDDQVPNSTHFIVSPTTNTNTNSYVAYLFTSVEGYSKIGSYTGNGNADGPFVYTGFESAFILIKETGNSNSWLMLDSTRSNHINPINDYIDANTNNAETADDSSRAIDFLSNGFKMRSSNLAANRNSGNYIYIAFAEKPLN